MNFVEEPPRAALAVEHSFDCSAGSARSARLFVDSVLSNWGLDPTAGLLATSELAANAILRANSDFRVALTRSDGAYVIAVTDRSPELPVPVMPERSAPQGRGLQIVDRLSRRWGVVLNADGGKTVWAEIAAGA